MCQEHSYTYKEVTQTVRTCQRFCAICLVASALRDTQDSKSPYNNQGLICNNQFNCFNHVLELPLPSIPPPSHSWQMDKLLQMWTNRTIITSTIISWFVYTHSTRSQGCLRSLTYHYLYLISLPVLICLHFHGEIPVTLLYSWKRKQRLLVYVAQFVACYWYGLPAYEVKTVAKKPFSKANNMGRLPKPLIPCIYDKSQATKAILMQNEPHRWMFYSLSTVFDKTSLCC